VSKTPSSGTSKKFVLFEIEEKAKLDEEKKRHLIELVQKARCEPAVFDDFVKRHGWVKAQKMLAELKQPTNSKMRKGFFGEVLTCALLTEFFGYVIPFEKWRYAIVSNQSLPGTDAIAFKASKTSISEICFVESKTRTVKDNHAPVEGYRQLVKDHSKSIPDMVVFTLGRLADRSDPLYSAFSDYTFDRRNLSGMETFCLGLIWDSDSWNVEVLNSLEEEVDNSKYPRLVVDRVLIKNLTNEIHDLFEKIGIGELADDD
jgi:hypothetical protein